MMLLLLLLLLLLQLLLPQLLLLPAIPATGQSTQSKQYRVGGVNRGGKWYRVRASVGVQQGSSVMRGKGVGGWWGNKGIRKQELAFLKPTLI